MRILSVFVLVFLSSCSIMLYEPASPNIPLFDSTHIFNSDITISTRGLDGKSNIRILKFGVLQFEINKSRSNISNFVEGAGGLLFQNDFFHLSCVGGYGESNTDFQEGTGGSSWDFFGYGRYNKYFFQPSIATGNKYNKIGLSFKFSNIDYVITDLNST